MVNYDSFWTTLRKRGISQYTLINTYHFSPSLLTRMRRNEYVSLRSLERLCRIIHCKLTDIVNFFPPEE